jgi:thymidine phosphorylase
VDPAVGFVFRARPGDRVEAGEAWVDVHARDESAADGAVRRLTACTRWADTPPEPLPIILETI